MTTLDIPLVFSLGLLGSVHCLQMCGPIVLAYSLPMADAQGGGLRRRLIMSHLAYNAGRITTYSVLGAVAGAAGHALGLIGRLAGFENIAAIVAGIFLIAMGISMAGVLPVSNLLRLDPTRLLTRLHHVASRLITAPSHRSKFKLGLLLGFLPCGLIYAALLKAMEAGNPVAGAVVMLIFGLGTAGALIVTGFLSSVIAVPLRRWGNMIAAVGVTLLGALLLYRGMMSRGILPHSGNGGAHSVHEHH
jgi:uncharacterized protein